MAAESCDWAEIDAVWISHFHVDHCSGLPALLSGLKHADETRDRTKELRMIGGKGLTDLISGIDSAGAFKLFEQRFPATVIEVEPLEPFEITGGIQATAMSTPHTPESLAIHIREGETTFVYTADTGFSDEIAAFAAGVDLLMIECSFHKTKPAEKHLTLAEAMHLIRKARPRRAVLTHFYPEWDAVDIAAEVDAFSPPCQVIAATDGLRLEIP
jgi:ribonuclease BN (tRNA processing enzyme)